MVSRVRPPGRENVTKTPCCPVSHTEIVSLSDRLRVFRRQIRTGDLRQPLHVSVVGRRIGNNDVADVHGLDTVVRRILFDNGTGDYETGTGEERILKKQKKSNDVRYNSIPEIF